MEVSSFMLRVSCIHAFGVSFGVGWAGKVPLSVEAS